MFFKKFELISNRMTIDFNQFDNIRFVVFSKFCFEETKRSHTKTKNEKQIGYKFKKNLFRYQNTYVFLFLYFKQKRNETTFFFRGAKKTSCSITKKRNIDIPSHYGVVVKCFASGQCGPGSIPGLCRSWRRCLPTVLQNTAL